MKLTQNDIATIEQAHDYLLDKSKLRFDTPLLSRLRDLSNGIINKMDNVDDELYVLSKKEILESYKNPDKLKDIAKEAFLPNPEKHKWYKVTYLSAVTYVYITEFISQKRFKCFGFNNNESFFMKDDSEIISGSEYSEPDRLVIPDLFKKEAAKRGFTGNYSSVYSIHYANGCKYHIDNRTVFNNGIWLDENTDINNLVKEAKKLEQKHGLKITLTFE